MMKRTAVALALALSAPLALAQSQGVTKDEIVIGSIQDLSARSPASASRIASG